MRHGRLPAATALSRVVKVCLFLSDIVPAKRQVDLWKILLVLDAT